MLDVVIATDDRTGALEVAGECAARTGGPMSVVPFGVDAPAGATGIVIDLGSRHLGAVEATRRARVAGGISARRRAHKLDSALRGNWAAEVDARGVDRAVVVAALPSVGRVCVDGVVGQLDDAGRLHPIAEVMTDDPRGAPASSRPAELMRDVGAGHVVELADAAALAEWIESGRPGVAVCDAGSADDLDSLGRTVVDSDALMVGTAAAIGAWWSPPSGRASIRIDACSVLVVCGSLDAGARAQLDRLHAAGRRDVFVVASADDVRRPLPDDVAESMAVALAAEARQVIGGQRLDVVVVLGGDTTAAVIGDVPMSAHGLVAPGTAISRRADGTGPWFVTRSGSFGGRDALRDLVTSMIDGPTSAAPLS